MKLKDRVAIVTGSSKGIGAGIAKVFSDEGAKVVVTCRTEDTGRKMAEEQMVYQIYERKVEVEELYIIRVSQTWIVSKVNFFYME